MFENLKVTLFLTQEDVTRQNNFLLSGRASFSVFNQAIEFKIYLVLSTFDDCDMSLVGVDTDAVMSDGGFFAIKTQGEF